jgi:polyribonucleotide nucleotidyltransferase
MTMFNKVTKTFQWGSHTVRMETGEIARQSSGAVLLDIEGTVVLATVVAKSEGKPGQDFFPLTVDYIEKTYAAGKIPGSFFKREGRPSEFETLTSRLIDRPIRPLFPEGFFNEVQVVIHTVSLNPEVDADIAALIATSAALSVSGIPFAGPIGAARVGYINGEYVLNPGQSDRKNSVLDLVVAGTEAAVLMVESEAQQLSEEVMLGAVVFGHEQGRIAIEAIHELVRDAGKPVWNWQAPARDEDLIAKVGALADSKLQAAYQIRNKQARTQACKSAYAEVMGALKAEGLAFDSVKVEGLLFHIEARIVRGQILAGDPASTAAIRAPCARSKSATACCRAPTARPCSRAARRRPSWSPRSAPSVTRSASTPCRATSKTASCCTTTCLPSPPARRAAWAAPSGAKSATAAWPSAR